MSSRIDQVNEIIGQKVSIILHDDILEPDQYFSITSVKTSPDLSYCDIEISFLRIGESSLKKIKHSHNNISAKLSKSLKLRKTPKLRFHIDKSSEYAEKIESIFNQL